MSDVAGGQHASTTPDQPNADAASFDAFYRHEHASIFREVLLICGSQSAADDVTQDAFARAWVRWADVSVMDRPGGWVRQTALRAAIKNKQRTRSWDELRDQAVTQPAVAEFDTALIDALAALSAQQRAAIVLTVIEQRSPDEVAALLGCRAATVRVHIHRARQALAALYRMEAPR